MKNKTPKESISVMSQIVLPPITNYFNNLMGGDLLRMMDVVASIAAKRHSEQEVVTVSVDGVSFSNPVPAGSILTIQGKITRAFKTSMEIKLEVWAEIKNFSKPIKTNEAYYSFVALDTNMRPKEVIQVKPETDSEKREYELALQRRNMRLNFINK